MVRLGLVGGAVGHVAGGGAAVRQLALRRVRGCVPGQDRHPSRDALAAEPGDPARGQVPARTAVHPIVHRKPRPGKAYGSPEVERGLTRRVQRRAKRGRRNARVGFTVR